ncbi:MAG: ABC transporter substrate-binding protein [Acidimicrobiales bacterium]
MAAAVAAVSLTLAAAGGAKDNATKPTLTIAYYRGCGATGVGLTPASDGGDGAFFDRPIAYESLIRANPDGSLVPDLATSWKIEPGNKTMTMTLRQGVRFSDGTPLTAQAVETWLNYRKTQNTGGADDWLNIRSIRVVSKYVVRITLKSPNPFFALTLSSFKLSNWGDVASPKAVAYAIANPKSDFFTKHTYGAGPYALASAIPGQTCTYVPNKHYYDPSKIKWGKIVTEVITNPSTMLAALQSGQVDVGDGTVTNVPAAKSSGLKVIQGDVVGQAIDLLDTGGAIVPALAKPQVRQALEYAINRKLIADSLYPGVAIPSSAPEISPVDPKLNTYYTYNPAKAKALLAAAGYPNGFTMKMSCVGPWAGNLNVEPLCEAVAQDLSAVGIQVNLDPTATGTQFTNDVNSKTFALLGVPVNRFPAWTAYTMGLTPTAGTNQHGFRDPVLDKLWVEGSRAQGKKADAIWLQFTRRLVTQAEFIIPILDQRRLFFASKRVGGVQGATGLGFPDPLAWYPTGS